MDRLDFKNGFDTYTGDWRRQQEQIYKAIEDQYKGVGAFVFSGCKVLDTSVDPGLVYLDGKVMEFMGASNVAFPSYLKSVSVQHEPRFFSEENANQTTRVKYYAELVGTQPVGDYIEVTATGASHFLKASVVEAKAASVDISTSDLTGEVSYRKVANLIEVRFEVNYLKDLAGGHIVFVLPSAYRPLKDVRVTGVVSLSADIEGVVVTTSGSINVYKARSAGEGLFSNFYFPAY